MSQSLYRKYRPRLFSEIIGQRHIIQTLSNAIKNQRIGQAYLFTGPRGTGKTTVARIFAKAINCLSHQNQEDASKKYFEPCLNCAICKNIADTRSLDIIEIDAASYTGVDNIRELRETIKLPSTQTKYKVYIIDEAHMLSNSAWNALLKTLEEPPSHVIFIFVTTEIHKVPDTIISRCQRFDFSRLTLNHIISKLLEITENEKVAIEKEALEMIAIAAEGGMRDAESLLEQVIVLQDKNITAQEVKEILGISDYVLIENLTDLILEKNASEALNLVNQISQDGYDLEIFEKSFLNYLRQLLLVSIDESLVSTFSFELTQEQIQSLVSRAKKHSSREILEIINILLTTKQNVRSSFIPQLALEIVIVKSIAKNNQSIVNNNFKNKDNTKNEKLYFPPDYNNNIQTDLSQKSQIQNKQKKNLETPKNKKNAQAQKIDISLDDIKKNWTKLLQEIKPHNHSLSGFLANCQPIEIQDNTIIISAKYKLYKEKLNENRNRLTIEKIFDKILGIPLKIKAITEEEAGIKTSTNKKEYSDNNKNKETNHILNEAIKIMGGKIIVEE